ncbi:MAG: hypothetical protein IKJ19_05020 [Clostridia bacterium]|nr:hypothetical protein [Clostridia bacterium]
MKNVVEMNTTLSLKDENKAKKPESKRNSFFELYRFLFAMWVVWYHGFFTFKSQYFDDGYLAVEFFFLLSGFFFLKSIEKYKDSSYMRGLFKMVWSKIKPLGLAFLVGVVFVIWQRVLEGQSVLFGYLWYIPIMLLAFVVIYTLHRVLKSKLSFIISLIAIVIISYLILYLPIVEKLGVARGFGAVSMGVLLSYIPKIELKIGKLNFNWIITALVFVAVVYLAYIPKADLTYEYILIFALMPTLIYFTSTLKVQSKFLNFLGSLSFGLYAYQCILRVIRMLYSLPQFGLFLILICLILADKCLKLMRKQYLKNFKLQKA